MAIIKASAEDFVVDEIPAYTPSGEGTHLYLHLRKRGRTTDDVVREIARQLGIERRDIGVAGLKDKVAVTTQWISVPAPAAIERLAVDGVEILATGLHQNKLKTGHLAGNRFSIVVRDVEDGAAALQGFERIAKAGVPNAFGAQRFGREGDTHERARAWLTGKERAPGDPRLRRFQFSALQSAIFNAVLAARVEDGTWDVPIAGDLLKKEDTGGIFVCTDVQEDRARAARGEVCPTGPILGDRMRWPEGEARIVEERITGPLIEGIDLRRARSLGEGTRRALRLRVTELNASIVDEASQRPGRSTLRVGFVLPKGAYATTVLENVLNLETDMGDRSGGRTEEEE